MKTNMTLLRFAAVACVSVALAGCALPRETVSRADGAPFGLVRVSYPRDLVHTYSRYEVYHWDEKGRKTLLWRYLANQLIWKDDLALFHGYLTTGPDDPGGATRRGVERLFAVERSGPVVDITDDVVHAWAEKSGTNVAYALKRQVIGDLTKHGDAVQIHIGLLGGGGGDIELTWAKISELIRDAKENGKQMKDPGYGTSYLKRDWKAQSSKP